MLQNYVAQYVRGLVLRNTLQGNPSHYLTIKNEIQTRFSIELSDNEILMIRDFKNDLIKTITPWAPVLRVIYSFVARVKPPSEPREY